MLLAAIDENHRGTYDFLYLPIDFKVTLDYPFDCWDRTITKTCSFLAILLHTHATFCLNCAE